MLPTTEVIAPSSPKPAEFEPAEFVAPVGAPAGIRSPTVVSMQLAGWAVLACLFLPLFRNCSGTVVRPVEELSSAVASPVSTSSLVQAAVLLSVYGNGVLAAGLITISAWLCSRAFWWRSFLFQFAVCLGLAVIFASLVLSEPTPTLTARVSNGLIFIPPLVVASSWVALAIRRGAHELAWARLQHTWTIGALLYVHLMCIFAQQLLFGYWLTMIGLAGMMLAVELARHRMQHDLWDASQPAARPQFTLASIFLWITLIPLAIGYYQVVEPLAKWLCAGR